MIVTILAVNYNCLKWMELLVKSVRKFTHLPHEIIIVDNHSIDGSVEWLQEQGDVKAIMLNYNSHHGPGLDMGLKHVNSRYCMVMDIDAHLQDENWADNLIGLYGKKKERKLIAAKGGDPDVPNAKPIHACFQFFETAFFKENNLSFAPREGHDVGRKNYYDVVNLGYEVLRIPAGYEKDRRKLYDGAWGDNYYIDGKRFLYHNWYSARMFNVKDPHGKVDNYEKQEFLKREKIVFEQKLVRKILET